MKLLEFLLILSALLSAVTGAFTGTRAPEPRPHHAVASLETAEAAAPRAVAPARIAAIFRSAVRYAGLPKMLPAGTAFALAHPAPLETIRLIE